MQEAVAAAAPSTQVVQQVQNLASQVRRLQCELKSAVQNSQQRFPAPRGNRNQHQGGVDDELQGTNPDSELQQHQGGSLMPVVGTQRYQRHDANSGKVSELRRKSDYEWERLERVTFEKLEEIKTEDGANGANDSSLQHRHNILI